MATLFTIYFAMQHAMHLREEQLASAIRRVWDGWLAVKDK
jgi:hypothetical protein